MAAELTLYKANASSQHSCQFCHQAIAGSDVLGHTRVKWGYVKKICKKIFKEKVTDELIKFFPEFVRIGIEHPELPSDFNKQSKEICAYSHPNCLKQALRNDPNCPSCHADLIPPKGFLSFTDKCLQKMNEFRRKAAPYCTPASIKKAVIAGWEGAKIGAQLATSIALTRLTGISDTPFADSLKVIFPSNETSTDVAARLLATHTFIFSTILSHLWVVSTKVDGIVERRRKEFETAIERIEKEASSPGTSQWDKLAHQSNICLLKQHIPKSSLERLYPLAALITTTFISSFFPYGLIASTAGIVAGNVISDTQMDRLWKFLKTPVSMPAALKKPLAALTGFLIGSGIASADAGFSGEAAVMLGATLGGAASSYV